MHRLQRKLCRKLHTSGSERPTDQQSLSPSPTPAPAPRLTFSTLSPLGDKFLSSPGPLLGSDTPFLPPSRSSPLLIGFPAFPPQDQKLK